MRFALILIIFLLAALLVPLTVLLRFDTDAIKPSLENQLSRHLAADARLGALRFHRGWPPEIEISGITVRPEGGGEAFLEAPKAVLRFRLDDFFSKRLRITLLSIFDARLRLVRGRDGWNGQTALSAAYAKPPSKGPESEGGMPLFFWQDGPWRVILDAAELRGAEIDFQDKTGGEAFTAGLHSVDCLIHATETDNLFRFQVQGEAPWLPSEPDVAFKGVLDTARKVILLTGSTTEQEWMFDGAVDLSGAKPQTHGELDIYNFDLSNDFVDGKLTAEAQGIVEGANPQEWFSSITTKGAIDIREGVFKPANLAGQALGLVLELLGEPGRSQDAWNFSRDSLQGASTAFDILQANAEIFHERLLIKEGLVKHKDYLMELDGSYDMAKREIDMKTKLVFLEDASRELLSAHPALRALLNEHGRIVIPFYYSGLLPRAVLRPDSDYIQMRAHAAAPDAGEIPARTAGRHEPEAGGKS